MNIPELFGLEWIAWEAIGTCVSAIIASIALFLLAYPKWQEYQNRPILEIIPSFEKIPFMIKDSTSSIPGFPVSGSSPTMCHYLLFKNKGKTTLKNVKYKITELKSLIPESAIEHVNKMDENLFYGDVGDIYGGDFTPSLIVSYEKDMQRLPIRFANSRFVSLNDFILSFIVVSDNHPIKKYRFKYIHNHDPFITELKLLS